MKNAIITGATGSVGIGLIEELIKEKINVFVLCHKNSKRVSHLLKYPSITILYCNLDELNKIKLNEKFDIFFHLGWEGTTGEGRNNYNLQLKNIHCACDAVSLAEEIGCHTFVGIGSQAEYGRTNQKLASYTSTNPESAYGIAKLSAGMITRLMCEERKIKHIWIRLLSVYGPYDSESSLVISTIKRMMQNKDIYCTQGSQIWDYIYYKDVARAIFQLSQRGKESKTYCIGSGEEVTLKSYIEKMRRYMDSSSTIHWGALPYTKKQVMYLCADTKELEEDIGFYQEITFEKGIKEIVNYFKENKDERI